MQFGLSWSAPASPHVQPLSGGRAALLANSVTSLSALTAWHADPCIILDTLVHLHTKAFKNQAAMIFLPVILPAGWPSINTTSFFINRANLSGGKGHSRSCWWDKIRKKMGVRVGLQLAYNSLVNGRKAIDQMNHRMKWNLACQEGMNEEDKIIEK